MRRTLSLFLISILLATLMACGGATSADDLFEQGIEHMRQGGEYLRSSSQYQAQGDADTADTEFEQ
ncbi:MAG: hypothetical protein PVH11_09480, partial [Anaerolineae bacterium]